MPLVHPTHLIYSSLGIMLIALLVAWLNVWPVWSQANTTSNSSSALDFGPVVFGGYNNYVYRDNVTSAQVVLSQ